MSISKYQAIAVVNGDASAFLIRDLKNKSSLISLVGMFGLLIGPPILVALTGIYFFLHLWWLIPVAVVYGIYLMCSNTAVFYASKQDLLNILGLFGFPIIAMVPLITMKFSSTVLVILFILISLISLYLFGLKSANSNALLNADLHGLQQISVLIAKVLVVPMFVLALLGVLDATKHRNADFNIEWIDWNARAIGIAVLTFIGGWFYKKSINARQVFEKRGMKFGNID